mgnify:CR=1 FL=1
MYALARRLLFRLDPERAHGLTLGAIRLAGSLPVVPAILRRMYTTPEKPVQAFGLRFMNPVGLAAGYDKDGLGWWGLACLGFGHIEVGTVTMRPQAGNPKPRIFRLPAEGALINRMGFPGLGAAAVVRNLHASRPPGLVLGVNLGKNNDTPLEQADQDYLALLRIFAPLADYLAINISSPNTVGLRRLQARDMLEGLLAALTTERAAQAHSLGKKVPLLVKLAPDLTGDELEYALAVIMNAGVDGVIATNTTLSRQGVHSTLASETGGLSGAPLAERSRAMVARIVHLTGGNLQVIGVGGIMDPAGAQAMLDAGACLVQVYTGLVYAGPGLVHRINKEIR